MAAHHQTIEARQAVAVADDPDDPAAGPPNVPRSPHEQLQHAVAAFYEVMRAHLVESPEGKRFFRGKLPDGPSDEGYGILARREHTEEIPLSDLPEPPEEANDREAMHHYQEALVDLERDGERFLPPANFFKDDDGTPTAEARYVTFTAGLKHLDDLFDQRVEVRVKEQSGPFGTRSAGNGFFPARERQRAENNTEIHLQLRPLRELINAARELDRAGRELDLLAETSESSMTPYMRDFDTSAGEPQATTATAELNGSPDME